APPYSVTNTTLHSNISRAPSDTHQELVTEAFPYTQEQINELLEALRYFEEASHDPPPYVAEPPSYDQAASDVWSAPPDNPSSPFTINDIDALLGAMQNVNSALNIDTSVEVPLLNDNDSDEAIDDDIELEDIDRHFWVAGDLKYQ
ncbi:hypothetical protein NCC49_002452, partial [Naganishia albida]